MVRNIRNIWILLQIRHKHTNEGAHLRRGSVPDLHWLCRRTPKSMPLAHALYCLYKRRHSAHIIHILYNGVPAEEWLLT